MEDYSFDYGKRIIFKNGAVYINADINGRITIPCAMMNKDYKKKKGKVELQDGKVIIKYSKDNSDINGHRRVTIPAKIRSELKLKRQDYFKVLPNKECTVFTLVVATDELTDIDIGCAKNE